jgi:hypothetical protein
LCVPTFGYYGAVFSFCAAIAASIGLAVWYQWSILGSKPIATKGFALQLFKLSVGLIAVNGISSWLVQNNVQRSVLLILANAVATLVLIRILKMVTHSDIDRYLGGNSRTGIVVEKLLIGETS